MVEHRLLLIGKTHYNGFYSSVGVHARYHGEQGRKKTNFRRAFNTWGGQNGNEAYAECSYCAGEYDLHVKTRHEYESDRMAYGGKYATSQVGSTRRVANAGKTDGGNRSKQSILKNI